MKTRVTVPEEGFVHVNEPGVRNDWMLAPPPPLPLLTESSLTAVMPVALLPAGLCWVVVRIAALAALQAALIFHVAVPDGTTTMTGGRATSAM
jgi:hypothetical protein